jgi:hypothetical protein
VVLFRRGSDWLKGGRYVTSLARLALNKGTGSRYLGSAIKLDSGEALTGRLGAM